MAGKNKDHSQDEEGGGSGTADLSVIGGEVFSVAEGEEVEVAVDEEV